MRIACLQFAPQVGDVDNNLNRADAVLSKANPKDLDLLVLPELAFCGHNFRSFDHVAPYLEPTAAGITSLWARTTALKHNCVVTVGYPEMLDVSGAIETYNSSIVVSSEGETIANYRKSFLYHTDERWAHEGPDGICEGSIEGLGNVAMGTCRRPTNSFERMDSNPYKFEAPWDAWDFAYHILHRQANLVIISMAWVTRKDARSFTCTPKVPDMETLSYWLTRLEPVIRAENVGEIIVVFANRTGTEEEATYAGTSAVLGIRNGEVRVYGILGRGEKELLVVDTDRRPQGKLVSGPTSSIPRMSRASSTAPSTMTAESRDTELSVDTDLTTPMPKSTTPESLSPIAASPDSPENMLLGLGLGACFDSAGDQICILSPVAYTPNTCFAPTSGSFPWPSELYDRPCSPKIPNMGQSRDSSLLVSPDPSIPFTRGSPSSAGEHQLTAPVFEVPIFWRPESPKLRNVSRSRCFVQKETSQSARNSFESPILGSHDCSPSQNVRGNNSPILAQDPLSTPDLRDERQDCKLDTILKSRPYSTSFLPGQYQTAFSRAMFGPRIAHTSPRPRSAMW